MSKIHVESEHTTIIAEMNLTPLVGVILLLLLIWIVALPTKKHFVSLVKAADYGCGGLRELESIEIDFDGVVTWRGQNLNDNELKQKLQRYVGDYGNSAVILHPNKLSKYNEVARVMAIAQKSGIMSLTLVADAQFLN